MYSTRTRVNARIPNGHPREEKRASGRPAAARDGHADFLARILAQKSARKSVSMSVSVLWNVAIIQRSLEPHLRCKYTSTVERTRTGDLYRHETIKVRKRDFGHFRSSEQHTDDGFFDWQGMTSY